MSIYVFKGRIIDAVSDEAIENGIVVVKDDHIDYTGEENKYDVPEDAEIIEIEDGTVLPGFIDCHAHIAGSSNGEFEMGTESNYDRIINATNHISTLLDAGFTYLRDMSMFGGYLKRAVEKGVIRGSKIMPGGRVMSPTAGHVDTNVNYPIDYMQEESPIGYLVDGIDECIKGVRFQFRQGAEFIKICATGGVSSAVDGIDDIQFSEEELSAIVSEAKRHGTYVAAHCSGNAGTYQALKAGVGCIEHGIMLDDRCIDIMVKNNIPLVTTLYVSMLVGSLSNFPEFMIKKGKQCAQSHIKSMMAARDAGIRIALGTDFSNSKNTPYAEIGREFAAIVDAGFSPMEAIKIGTINAAYVLRRENMLGSLEKGKLADIVVVKGNPLKNINILAHKDNVKVVMQNGVVKKYIEG